MCFVLTGSSVRFAQDEVWVNSAKALQGGESSGEVKAVAAVDGNGGAAAGQAAAGGGTAGAAPAGDKSPHEVAPQVRVSHRRQPP